MKIQLREIAFARSGDKGDTANVGVIAYTEGAYDVLVEELTERRVKRHFEGVCEGEVERYELPNLRALNFLLHRSLDGGGTRSLMLDAQGKTFSTAMLRMEVDAPVEVLEEVWERRADRNPGGGEGATVTRRGAE